MGRRIPTTAVGAQFRKQLTTSRFIDKFRNVSTSTGQQSDGTAISTLKTGPYTYKGFYIMIRSKVAIAGKTFEADGKHYVQTANMADYIAEIALEIDNEVEREYPFERFLQMNEKDGYAVQDGVAVMAFGGPYQFDDMAVEDVYALGTSNLRSLELSFQLTSDWVNTQMFIDVFSDYTSVARPLSFIRTTKTVIRKATGAGEFSIDGLPTHSDIASIYVLGDHLNGAKLVIDDQEIESSGAYVNAARNKLHGVNVDALGAGVVFDFLKDKDVRKGLRSLETAAQRKRNADIRIDCDMADAAELTVIVDLIGRYSQQG